MSVDRTAAPERPRDFYEKNLPALNKVWDSAKAVDEAIDRHIHDLNEDENLKHARGLVPLLNGIKQRLTAFRDTILTPINERMKYTFSILDKVGATMELDKPEMELSLFQVGRDSLVSFPTRDFEHRDIVRAEPE